MFVTYAVMSLVPPGAVRLHPRLQATSNGRRPFKLTGLLPVDGDGGALECADRQCGTAGWRVQREDVRKTARTGTALCCVASGGLG